MGLFDFLTGEDDEQEQKIAVTDSSQTERVAIRGGTTAETQERGVASAGTRSDVTTQDLSARFLDQDIELVLSDLIKGLSERSGVVNLSVDTNDVLADNRALQQTIQQRATSLPANINADIANIIGEARRQGEDELQALTTRAATAAGSSQNSLVSDIEASGRAELESRLAGQLGQLNLAALQPIQQAEAAAFAAGDTLARTTSDISSQPITDITALSELLKGATQTIQQSGTADRIQAEETAETVNRLSEALDAIEEFTKGTTVRTGTTNTEGSSTGSILDIFQTIAAFSDS